MSRASRRSKVKSPHKAAGASSAKKGPSLSASRRKQGTKAVPSVRVTPDAAEVVDGEPLTDALFPLEAVPRAVEKSELEAPGLYDPEDIVDAPEHHALSKALGLLTWAIWDHDVRPVSERKRDFATAFPPKNPTVFSLTGMERRTDHEWTPRTRDRELERFLARDGRANGVDSILARYGLKLKDAPPLQLRTTPIREFLQAARERNHGLRMLHGSVDIEPKDMDSAKSAFVEQQERRRAAEEIRAARKRLEDELKNSGPT